jgi:glucose-6-phosphate-specific signal transduction histidine kinase
LTLQWDVQDLPDLQRLDPPEALHVLRLMQEARNTVLKHANTRPRRARMVARHYGRHVGVRIDNNGDGFNPEYAQKRGGPKSQPKCGQRLGGHIQLESSTGRDMRLSLRLPVQSTGHSKDPNDQG